MPSKKLTFLFPSSLQWKQSGRPAIFFNLSHKIQTFRSKVATAIRAWTRISNRSNSCPYNACYVSWIVIESAFERFSILSYVSVSMIDQSLSRRIILSETQPCKRWKPWKTIWDVIVTPMTLKWYVSWLHSLVAGIEVVKKTGDQPGLIPSV